MASSLCGRVQHHRGIRRKLTALRASEVGRHLGLQSCAPRNFGSPTNPMDFATKLKRQVARVERGIDLHLPLAATRPARLHTAMRYSLEAGGKRLRPVLLLATAELFG